MREVLNKTEPRVKLYNFIKQRLVTVEQVAK